MSILNYLNINAPLSHTCIASILMYYCNKGVKFSAFDQELITIQANSLYRYATARHNSYKRDIWSGCSPTNREIGSSHSSNYPPILLRIAG